MDETSKPSPETSSPSTYPRLSHRNKSQSFLALVPLAFIAGIMVGYIFWGQSTAGARSSVPTAVVQDSSGQQLTKIVPTRYNVPVENNPSSGPENAPITLIEFSDYECPFCKVWFTDTYPQLVKAYPGKIRFVYRDFPISGLHANASPAAEAADCAGEQGQYWPFHDQLFSNQLGLGSAAYLTYATNLGLDTAKFQNCLDTHKYQAAVEANYAFANNLGVQSTPTFFINGLAVVGAQPFAVFKQIIDQELAGQIP